ncbi:hypothetical protein [Bacillus benzoevorans]|uniref:Uncharacterized protein n=1 Tax=Bacillus benzoevorans TaxID=1456 RepID=A0A7X0LW47_9BACI|nr:hypothetical protein [Bacillus benzoevorans]MBB6446711.1 hypothetical protein [Bacillus benzoevorans]
MALFRRLSCAWQLGEQEEKDRVPGTIQRIGNWYAGTVSCLAVDKEKDRVPGTIQRIGNWYAGTVSCLAEDKQNHDLGACHLSNNLFGK